MIDIQKQKVVVIGHNPTLRLGIVRSVAELGCEIIVIVISWHKRFYTPKPFDCYSKHISQIYYCHNGDCDGLVRLLLSKCKNVGHKVILFPLSDFSVMAIDKNKALLQQHFLFPYITNSEESIHSWMNKKRQKKLARDKGLNIPESHIIEIKNKAYKIPDDIRYPCFTKALTSIVGGKECFNKCSNKEELCLALDAIGEKYDVCILVEDYKKIENEYAILGFSDGKEVVIPGIMHIIQHSYSHFGVAMTGEVIPPNKGEFDRLLEQFKSFVRQIGFIGLFDIDFYYSENKFYFGEMNLRFGASGYAVTKLGVNLPAMMIKCLRNEDTSQMNKRIENKASFVNECICEDDWCSGKISSKEYCKIISSKDISFVNDSKDLQPQRVYDIRHFVLYIKRFLNCK